MHEKVIKVEGTSWVWAVDISPDSTRFATGTGWPDHKASIWNITTGERLVGPLKHDGIVNGIKFSPNGEHLATAWGEGSIRIFDSRSGVELIMIKTDIPSRTPITPFAWSSDSKQIFAESHNKIKAFDVSTGSQLAESQILRDGDNDVLSIALANNGKFVATFSDRSILFLDASTLTRIGFVIADGERIRSIDISVDSSYVATGRGDGKIVIHDLSNILPDSYGAFNVSICSFIIAHPHSMYHADKLCRYLLASMQNKTGSP